MQKIAIEQGASHYVEAESLPALDNGAKWLVSLFNESTGRRFMATESTKNGKKRFTWESGTTIDPATGVVSVLADKPNSTAQMCEGAYQLQLIASDLSASGTTPAIYEVYKGSIMASVSNVEQ